MAFTPEKLTPRARRGDIYLDKNDLQRVYANPVVQAGLDRVKLLVALSCLLVPPVQALYSQDARLVIRIG